MRATVTNFFFILCLNSFILLPLHIHAQGGTEVEIGLVMGLFNAVGIVAQPFAGPWVDAIGRRPFMLAGPVFFAVSALLAAAASSIPVLAAVRVLQGLGFSMFFVASYSYVIDLVPPARRGWALGLYGASGLLATAVAPVGSEWVIRRWGFRPLFVVAAGLAAVTFAFVWRLQGGHRGPSLTVRASLFERGGVAELFHRPMAVTLFFGLGAGTVWVFLPTFAEGLGVQSLALFYTAYAVAAIGVRVFGGRLLDTHGRRAVIVPAMFMQAMATALLAMLGFLVSRTSPTPVLPVVFVAGLLSGGAHGFLYPGLAALVTDEAPETRRGVVVGLFSGVFLFGQTTGSFAFGYVAHAAGYAVMWSVLTALLLGGAGLSLRLRR
ncbi:MAG: MFS transporter [Candidatus Rokubacteria bacterium]|nr:MFS transporter [Candidatus Rokubacteria bacterium]MBI4629406.1 MFS transporter [Candidatus Rokubacteria bacterium]